MNSYSEWLLETILPALVLVLASVAGWNHLRRAI